MTAGDALRIDLDRLTDVARQEIEASRGSVAAGFSDEAWTAIDAVTARLVAAGVDRGVARQVVTDWIITKRSVTDLLVETGWAAP